MTDSTKAADAVSRALKEDGHDTHEVVTAPIPPEEQLRRSLGVSSSTHTMVSVASPDASITIPFSPEPPTSATNLLAPVDLDGADRAINYDLPIIKCVNLHKTYLMGLDGVPALRGVNLSIFKGEFVIILGKSGGGKTSLLNILGTIDKPSKGELFLAGKRITSATTDDEFARLRLQNIGFVFQQFNLISTMTALENVSLPMTLFGKLSRAEVRKRAQALLDMVGVGERSHHLPSQLSGGEQQRVTIARAISNRPDVLLLDEPTGDLDTKNSHLIMDMLVKLNRKEGITLVMVTHDTELVDYAHKVVHVVDGKIMKVTDVSPEKRKAKEAALALQLIADREERQAIVEQKRGITEVRDTDVYYNALKPIKP